MTTIEEQYGINILREVEIIIEVVPTYSKFYIQGLEAYESIGDPGR